MVYRQVHMNCWWNSYIDGVISNLLNWNFLNWSQYWNSLKIEFWKWPKVLKEINVFCFNNLDGKTWTNQWISVTNRGLTVMHYVTWTTVNGAIYDLRCPINDQYHRNSRHKKSTLTVGIFWVHEFVTDILHDGHDGTISKYLYHANSSRPGDALYNPVWSFLLLF